MVKNCRKNEQQKNQDMMYDYDVVGIWVFFIVHHGNGNTRAETKKKMRMTHWIVFDFYMAWAT